MTESIVFGGSALIRERAGELPRVVPDAGLYQENGTIVEVGPVDALRAKHPGVACVGSPEHILLPGFVNAHHHVGITAVQLGTYDQPLEQSFAARLAFRDVDPYLDTLYSAFEMIASGVTTVQHLHNPRRGGPTQWRPAADRVIDAYRAVGMRVSYSLMVRVRSRLVYGDDDAFVASLPDGLREKAAAHLASYSALLEAYLEHFTGMHEAYRGEPRVAIQLAPGNLDWCTDEALVRLAETSERYGVGMHMHLLETVYQRVYAERTTGESAVAHLARLGVLGPRLTLGHGVWCSERDIELIAESGTMLCHNPSSNTRLHSGIAPFCEYLDRGVVSGLGIDEANINDERDFLFEMRYASKLHRLPGIGNRYPSAAEIVMMATESGAKTTGFAERTGALAPGLAADCVLIDRERVGYPYLDATVPALEAIVYRAKPSHVDTVMVDGEVIYQGGAFTRIDAPAAVAELAEQLRRPLRDDELERRPFAEALVPHVQRFYQGWLEKQPDGFDARAAR